MSFHNFSTMSLTLSDIKAKILAWQKVESKSYYIENQALIASLKETVKVQ